MKMLPKKYLLKQLFWIIPLSILGAAVAVLLYSTFAPYHPFQFKEYTVQPATVCAGGHVKATVTRKFTEHFDHFSLKETWMTRNVIGLAANRPVQENKGTLPKSALHPTRIQKVQSPLLNTAPRHPGVYYVRIHTESHGTRLGFIPAVGTSTYYSNIVHVIDCQQKNGDK